jgi:very-short-patch-repair endonuclease
VARDRDVDRTLVEDGWVVIRAWDFDIRKRTPEVVARIAEAVSKRRAAKLA